MLKSSFVVSGGQKVDTYASSETVSMGDPNKYSAQGGVLTFRGGPLRQNAAYGTVEVTEEQLSVVRGMRTSRLDNTYTGFGFGSQPLIVKWYKNIREMMNITDESKNTTAMKEGIVPSDIWLTCRKKLMNNMKIQSARKATHTWLAGKIKCGNCGYALMSIYNPSGKQYLRCTKRLDNKSCPGCGKIITSELEAVVYQQMVKKLASYKTLTGKKKAAKANPKITALQVELAHVDSEIEKLVDSLTGANNVLFSYVNVKIAELDGRKQELLARIAELTVEAISPEQVSQISGYLDTWENVSFDDKRRVVDLMITTIAATSDSLNITWKI